MKFWLLLLILSFSAACIYDTFNGTYLCDNEYFDELPVNETVEFVRGCFIYYQNGTQIQIPCNYPK